MIADTTAVKVIDPTSYTQGDIIIDAIFVTAAGASVVQILCDAVVLWQTTLAAAGETTGGPGLKLCCPDGADVNLDQSASVATTADIRWWRGE